jgi:hypothetical protein
MSDDHIDVFCHEEDAGYIADVPTSRRARRSALAGAGAAEAERVKEAWLAAAPEAWFAGFLSRASARRSTRGRPRPAPAKEATKLVILPKRAGIARLTRPRPARLAGREPPRAQRPAPRLQAGRHEAPR